MPKYRKKPIVIEAIQWTGLNNREIKQFMGTDNLPWDAQRDCVLIKTLEGNMEASKGDYIIKGIRGEFYPCKPDIFLQTYDAVGEENKRSTIAVDFDGVIHAYSKGWHDGTIYDKPMDGAEVGLKKLMEAGNLFILSTRDPGQIKEWMDKNISIPTEVIAPGTLFWNKSGVIGITNQKLAAIAYIDDRAVPFDSWSRLIESKAVNFK